MTSNAYRDLEDDVARILIDEAQIQKRVSELAADIEADYEQNAFELDRKLLVDEDKVFIFKDSVLQLVQVDPIFFTKDKVVLRGLADGTKVISRAVPGAFDGMQVKEYNPTSN